MGGREAGQMTGVLKEREDGTGQESEEGRGSSPTAAASVWQSERSEEVMLEKEVMAEDASLCCEGQ